MTTEKTVLIVEDEGLVAMDIEDELSDRGWKTVAAVGTIDAAMSALETQVPDLALLDVNLRGTKSFDLALTLRDKGVAVVFLSGNSVNDLPASLQDCAFVQKPVNFDLLQTALGNAVTGDRL
ncbi:MAG: response regulator [Pseudomonadota bacterium]